KEIDSLVGFEVIFHPEAFALFIDPHVGMAGVAVHMPPCFGHATIPHQPGHLMSGLRGKRPEIPLHIMITKTAVRPTLLRPDKMLEFHRIPHKEYGGVIAYHIIISLAGIKLKSKTTGVAP